MIDLRQPKRRALQRQPEDGDQCSRDWRIAMLAPHENAKTLIERQILDLERRVERFGKGDD